MTIQTLQRLKTIIDIAWNGMVLLFISIEAVYLPLRLVSSLEFFAYNDEVLCLISGVFTLDILYNLRQVRRLSETDPRRNTSRKRVMAYLRERFWIDLLAALSLHLIVGWTPLVLLRLVKLFRIRDMLLKWRHTNIHIATSIRLGGLLYLLAILSHWIACGWIVLRPLPPNADFTFYYVRALYWAITTLSTVGYGDVTPNTIAEMLYAMSTMATGVIVFGYVIGNIANLLNNIDLPRKHYFERSEQIRAFMQYRKLPNSLQRRINEYYAYYWEKQLAYDENTVLAGLPSGLRTEVSLYLKREAIEKVEIFRETDEEFIRDIALQLRPVLFTPNDVVFRAGEAARSMYFVIRGRVEVVSPSRGLVAVLGEGDFFGEIALLLNRPRSASARALEYCDMYVLDKDVFHAVLMRHPQFAERIEKKVLERQQQHTQDNHS
jgi:voltage-gated potassium channel